MLNVWLLYTKYKTWYHCSHISNQLSCILYSYVRPFLICQLKPGTNDLNPVINVALGSKPPILWMDFV